MGVLDMLTTHTVLRVQLVAYTVLIFFSFFIFVGVAVLKDRTVGDICPLYVDLGGYVKPESNCNYPMVIAIIFQLIYLLYRVVILVLFVLGKFNSEMFLFSNIMEMVHVMMDVIIFILTFIGACILSAGHNNSSYIKYLDNLKTPSNVAQAGAWISTVLWLFISIVGVLYILRSGKLTFTRSSSAATTGTTGPTTASASPVDTPPSYDASKY